MYDYPLTLKSVNLKNLQVIDFLLYSPALADTKHFSKELLKFISHSYHHSLFILRLVTFVAKLLHVTESRYSGYFALFHRDSFDVSSMKLKFNKGMKI